MTKKNLKFLMEMIFIFILPLLFILPCIKIKDNFVYDNEGNYQVSEKIIEFDNSVINYTKLDYFKPSISSNDSIYQSGSRTKIWQELNFNNNGGYYTLSQLPLTIHTSGKRLYNGNFLNWYNVYIYINYNSELEEWSFSSNFNSVVETMDYGISLRDNEFTINYLNYEIDASGNIIPLPEEVSNKVLSINKDLQKSVNNLFGNIKDIILSNLGLQDNILIDIVVYYTFLWFIMFIIWHLFYLLLDLLLHFWRKEDK